MHIVYVMDPMCSWCWAFRPSFELICEALPDAGVVWVMGGLAPDSDEPMDSSMREYLAATWRRIENQTGTGFNHDYWNLCAPRRSTYPACRAVIAARQIDPALQGGMVAAIQRSYYLEARNPSDAETLIDAAVALGLDRDDFSRRLADPQTDEMLRQDLMLRDRLGVAGFPCVLIESNGQLRPLAQGYMDVESTRQRLDMLKDVA